MSVFGQSSRSRLWGSELRTERGFLGNGHLLASGAGPCPDSPAGHKGAFQRAAWEAVSMSSPKHSQMAPDTAPAQLYRKTRGCIVHGLPATNSHGLLALILLRGTHLVTPSSGDTVPWPLRPPLPLSSLPALPSPFCRLRLLLWPQKMGFLKAWLRPCSNLSLQSLYIVVSFTDISTEMSLEHLKLNMWKQNPGSPSLSPGLLPASPQ